MLNVANAVTVTRLVVVPVFVALTVVSQLRYPGWRIAACVAFCLASATDYLDGWIARSWNLVTVFGKVADPIADKALTGSALVLLSMYRAVPWWVTIVILFREVGITVLRFVVIRHAVISASRGGKLKTALQILAIVWCLVPFPAGVAEFGLWLMMIAMLVTVITGIDYVLRAARLTLAPRGSP